MMAFWPHFQSSLLVMIITFVAICYGQLDSKGFTRNPNSLIAYMVLSVVLGIFALTFSVITCYICYKTRPRCLGWRPRRSSPNQAPKSEPRGWRRDVERSRGRPSRQERIRDRTQVYNGNFFMMASTEYKPDPLKVECSNPNNPQKFKLYADLGADNGQWYLNLKNGSWVLQPAKAFHHSLEPVQDSHNDIFLVYTFDPSKVVGGIVIAATQTEDINDKGNCLEAASASQLGVTELPEAYLQGSQPVQPFLFNAKPHNGDGYVMESLEYRDYYLTIPFIINSRTPLLYLATEQPNWFNQVFHTVDYGRYDGTQEFVFKQSE